MKYNQLKKVAMFVKKETEQAEYGSELETIFKKLRKEKTIYDTVMFISKKTELRPVRIQEILTKRGVYGIDGI